MMLKTNIENYLNQLVAVGPRAPGSWGELKAAELIKTLVSDMGVEVEFETFTAPSHLAEKSLLTTGNDTKFASLPCMFSPAGEVEGELVFIGNCHNSFVDDIQDLSGKIGLLNPSGDFQERIDFILDLERRGLEALIVVSPGMDAINSKIIRYPEIKKLPNISVSYRTAAKLKKMAGEKFSLTVTHCTATRQESVNVVAKIAGSGDDWLTIAAHIDTASDILGVNDNASGCAAQLELLRQMAQEQHQPEATICFLFAGSEEYGGLDMCGAGAEAFYQKRQAELDHCVAHISLDDIGNSLWPLDIFWGGNQAVRDIITNQKSELKYQLIEKNSPSCDHGPAIKRGIPYLWFNTAAHPRPFYHTPADNFEFFDIDVVTAIFPLIKQNLQAFAGCKPFFPYITSGDRLIRPGRFSDIATIKQITQLAFEPVSLDRMAKDFYGKELGDKAWYEYKNGAVEAQCKANIYHVIVCEIADKVVGYATMLLDFERGMAEIGNNAVHPDWQGQGIGKMMQQAIMRRMKTDGFERFKVATLSNDIAAQKVYEKLGFTKIIEGYYYLNG